MAYLTIAERKAALEKNPTAKLIWRIILGLIVLGTVWGIISLVLVLTGVSSQVKEVFQAQPVGTTVGFSVTALFLLALQVIFFLGVFYLERWVLWIMLFGVMLGLPGLASSTLANIVNYVFFTVLPAVGYTYVIQYVKKAGQPTQPAA